MPTISAEWLIIIGMNFTNWIKFQRYLFSWQKNSEKIEKFREIRKNSDKFEKNSKKFEIIPTNSEKFLIIPENSNFRLITSGPVVVSYQSLWVFPRGHQLMCWGSNSLCCPARVNLIVWVFVCFINSLLFYWFTD